ncbi:serine hydrolase domain-containing protein [Pedobacter duraquae]|uniref:CubicO group peptidase (Beta-lactamase class C family) n=1 Tax=Pedobacter duraquae TaxID=425511 RepID=A0A4R6ILA7_9SPHI|nr:serine hydrolase domain-containing protein [Pedobacter duraquae]TDO22909.1 CubicO group peptidase (beta-lactamase class C family) [Pedobacter duraquae]
MLQFVRFSLFMLLCLALSFPGFSQVAKAESEIQELMKQLEVVGLSVVVVKKGDVVYTKSFGLKNRENNTALATTDLFRIASISKSFSATSVMQLAAAGKLSLDEDFGKLVGFKVRNPKFPETVITLKMVLSHRSSINDSQGYFNLDVINPDKNPDWAKCYNTYEPGAGYQYCNLNYNLVGTVIEKLSGERFDQYVKHHVLDPLGVYGGYCVDSLDKSRFTTLYEYNAKNADHFSVAELAYNPRSEEIKNYVMGYSTPIFSPTGGMKISAPDLAKVMTMHMNLGKYKKTRIMAKKYAKAMQTKLSDEEGYGMAMMTLDNLIAGKTMKGHTGSAYGLYSAMFFQPKDQFGFVVITNGCNPIYTRGMNDVLRQTMNILYRDIVLGN